MTLLQRLRASKTGIARVAVPLVAAVWVGAPASACTGMLGASVQHAPAAVESLAGAERAQIPPTAAHAHHGKHGPTGGVAAERSSAHPPGSAHTSHADHSEHAADSTAADSAAGGDAHGKCPRCAHRSAPAHDGAHAGCASLSGADARAPATAVLQLDVKYASVAALTVHPPSPKPLLAPIRGAAPPAYRSIPLNLRHCVFLI